MSLEASITLIYDVYSTGITYDDLHLMIIICLQYRQQMLKSVIGFLALSLLITYHLADRHLVDSIRINRDLCTKGFNTKSAKYNSAKRFGNFFTSER